jgi:replication factor C subunit 2/4
VDTALEACTKIDFKHAQQVVTDVIAEGYSVTAFLEQLMVKVMETSELKDAQKARVMAVMAVADKCLVDGADAFLQLQHVLSVLQRVCTGQL